MFPSASAALPSVVPGLGPVPGVAAAPAGPAPRPLFRPFASSASSCTPVAPSAPASSASAPFPSVASSYSHFPSLVSPVAVPSAPFAFGVAPDELPDEDTLDAVPQDTDPSLPQVIPEAFRSEFRRMLAFIIDLFPQAAGSPSVPPPPRALFEDFFAPASVPPQPIFLNWFERVRAALADVDARMAATLAAGRSDFSFIPSRSPSYTVHGDSAQGRAVPVNPSLLSLFEPI